MLWHDHYVRDIGAYGAVSNLRLGIGRAIITGSLRCMAKLLDLTFQVIIRFYLLLISIKYDYIITLHQTFRK